MSKASAWRAFLGSAFSPSIDLSLSLSLSGSLGGSGIGRGSGSGFEGSAGQAGGPVACGLFVRLVGVVYLVAFGSLWPQLSGLVGASGVLPAAPFLRAVAGQLGAQRYVLLPTLLWLGCSDGALHLCCGLGIVGALLVICGRWWWPALAILWVCYLSLVSVGRDFMSFQWDTLLLETGLLTLLLVPGRPLWRASRAFVPAGRWLLLWLLWRLLFGAGWAKLRSGDPTWRDLTALHYHFETQPLPTWLGYYAHRLPAWLKRLSVLGMFVIELGVPALMAIPWGLGRSPRWQRLGRRMPLLSFFLLAGLMGLIAATGNYGFFNLLAVVLGLPLVPDSWLRRVLPAWLVRRLVESSTVDATPAHETALPSPSSFPSSSMASPPRRAVWAAVRGVCAGVLLLVSSGQALTMFVRRAELPEPLETLITWTEPFHLSSRYGLFAVMTTTRPEIILEGSRDGTTWTPYEFKYKPGDIDRAPRWVAPHQPRLDWQMWFAALAPAQESPWLQGLCIRLLQGAPEVLWLLDHDPFVGRPPRYLRALIYSYRFTTAAEHAATGAYWHRDPQKIQGDAGPIFFGPVSLSAKAETAE